MHKDIAKTGEAMRNTLVGESAAYIFVLLTLLVFDKLRN